MQGLSPYIFKKEMFIMAVARKCDICGVFYELGCDVTPPYAMVNPINAKVYDIPIRYISIKMSNSMESRHDICPECVSWLQTVIDIRRQELNEEEK